MSIVCQPVPLQISQRPPSELKEKSRAVIPRETARPWPRRAVRMSSQAFDVGHGVRPRRATERALVDEQDVDDVLQPLDPVVLPHVERTAPLNRRA